MRMTSRAVQVVARVPRAWVVIGTWMTMWLLAYPGVMTFDSAEQLAEARTGIYSDAHPPAMAWLWSLCDFVVRGPLGMLLLQTGLFVVGCYRLLASRVERRLAAWVTLVICLLPQNLLVFFAIWKDCAMAGWVMFGLSLLVAPAPGDARVPRWRLVLGLACVGLGTAMRHNAFAATVPLVFLVFEVRPGMPWLKRYSLSLLASLAMVTGAFAFNAALTSRKLYFWYNSVAVMDIAGTLHRVSPVLPDSDIAKRLAGTRLRVTADIHAHLNKVHRAGNFLPLIEGEAPLFDLPMTGVTTPLPRDVREALFAAWWSTITDYPRQYLAHRADLWWKHLHTRTLLHWVPSDPPGEWSRVQRAYLTASAWFSWATLVWFLPIVVLVGIVGYRDALVRALMLSGLGLEASLFFIAPSRDYRYGHWLVVCALCGLVIAAAARANSAARRTSAVAK